MKLDSSPGRALRSWWARCAGLPFGSWIFSRALGFFVPYAGTVRPDVLELGAGRARVALADRRSVRNHLGSIHAIALMNVAEMSTGLAVAFDLPDGMRSILVKIEMEYVKKSRGRIVSVAEAPKIADGTDAEVPVSATLTDAAGEVVARATAVWKVGPLKARS